MRSECLFDTVHIVEECLRQARGSVPLMVLLTDGRATGSPEALGAAREAAGAVADAGIEALVLDAEEPGHTSLGLAPEIASLMAAPCIHLSTIDAPTVESALRRAL